MKQQVEETKTKVKPPTAKAGGGSIPVTKPAEKVKPAPGDASVKSDRTPTAATAGKKVVGVANGKPEESKKEEEKQSAAEKKREEAE